MSRTQFEYGYGPGGWMVRSRQGTQESPLMHVVEPLFQTELRGWSVPAPVGFVGHCVMGAHWCIVCKEPAKSEYLGLLLDEADYAELEFDPYRATAREFGLPFVSEVVQKGRRRRIGPDVKEPLSAANDPGYLEYAYGCFLTTSLFQRRKKYWSLVPFGIDRAGLPTTWFTAEDQPRADIAWAKLFPEESPPVAVVPDLESARDERHEQLLAIAVRIQALVNELQAALGPAGANPKLDPAAGAATAATDGAVHEAALEKVERRLDEVSRKLDANASLTQRTLDTLERFAALVPSPGTPRAS